MVCQFNVANKMQNTNDVMEKLNMSMLFGVQLELDILLTDWVLNKTEYSWETKVGKMLTLAPKRYTAEFCMVAKVVIWCI